jgi:ATP-dependent RNA helicase RhlE
MLFENLGITESILQALRAKGYTHPTPIQEQAIPILLKRKDLLGCAQTGTGKTAAFAIPILQHLLHDRNNQHNQRRINALIVTPTRELAIQIGESFDAYGKYTGITNTVIFGGVKQHAQTAILQKGVDILVATPGRLLDLINQRFISLKEVKYFVLDEADRMLDMGFIHDIRKIIALLPAKRQSLFFSATMPPDIIKLSQKILGNPQKVSVTPEKTTAEKVKQSVYYVGKKNKPELLIQLLKSGMYDSTLVFSRTKHGANKIVKILKKAEIESAAIHGNKSQTARQQALGDFKNGTGNVLIATDIAARGIDVEELSLVVNYDLPNIPETYIHRIGRTGRANAAGLAISFCDDEEQPYLRDIQKLIGEKIPVVNEHEVRNYNVGEAEISNRPKPQNNKQFFPHTENREVKKVSRPRNNYRSKPARKSGGM